MGEVGGGFTADKQHAVLRAIPSAGEAQGILLGEAADAVGRAEDVVAQRVTLEEQVLELVVDELGGRVLVALNLVAHHLALLLDLCLRKLTVEDNVAEHVERPPHMVGADGTVVDRVLLVGEGVELAAQTLDVVDDAYGRAPPRALEAEVLAEVGQPLLAGRLVAGAGADGDAAVDHRRLRRQVDHAQPVLERKSIVVHDSACKGRK